MNDAVPVMDVEEDSHEANATQSLPCLAVDDLPGCVVTKDPPTFVLRQQLTHSESPVLVLWWHTQMSRDDILRFAPSNQPYPY